MEGLEQKVKDLEKRIVNITLQLEELKQSPMMFPRLYDVKDVAAILRVSNQVVRKLNRDGLLKSSARFNKNKKAYTKQDIDNYLNEYVFKPAVVMQEHVEQALSA